MLVVSLYLIILFYFIVVSFSSFYVLFRFVSHSLSLPLSSCLGCIPPLIGLPFLRSLLRSVLCGCLLSVSSVCVFVCVSICCLIWFGFVYLVTTAGFVAKQLIM